MSLNSGLARARRFSNWFMRQPPKARAVLAAVAGFIGLMLVITGLWPLLAVVAAIFLLGGDKKAPAPEPHVDSIQKALRGSVQAVVGATRTTAGKPDLSAALRAAARQAEALAARHPDGVKARPRLLRSPPAAPRAANPVPAASAARPIVEDGDGFWRRRGSRSRSIVE